MSVSTFLRKTSVMSRSKIKGMGIVQVLIKGIVLHEDVLWVDEHI